MRVVVDFDLCAGHAQCEEAAPEVFWVNDRALVEVLDENPPESLRTKVEDAVRRCPADAISLVD